MKHGFRIAALSFVVMIVGCGGPTESPESTEALLQQITSGQANAVSLSEVAEILALGGKSTDVQREQLTKDLVGSVVEWKIQVYDISVSDDVYNVVSQPLPAQDPDAYNLLHVLATVVPKSEHDHSVLRSAKTGDMLTVKGVVKDVVMRAAITISPAILVE